MKALPCIIKKFNSCIILINTLYFLTFSISKLGGVIGDIEGMPYIEAMRQLQFKVGRKNFCCCHVSLIPEVRLLTMFIEMIIQFKPFIELLLKQ